MEGMGEMDNAPIPPMGADDMGMGEPMDEPTDMGGEEPMNGEDDELMNVVNSLSTEDKAAVLKYAKSMADDSEGGGEMPQDDNMGAMPMESRENLQSIIDETINDVLNGEKRGTKRDEKEMPKEYKGLKSPFKSPF